MNKKYFIKITETTTDNSNNSYYLHSPDGIISYKDKKEAKKRIQSLSAFFNLKKNKGIEISPEERTRKPRDAKPFRWVMIG
tara:strand:+ start:186 stop:428 length:243 start_codon:yes stop_codon:yes gene_type:complete